MTLSVRFRKGTTKQHKLFEWDGVALNEADTTYVFEHVNKDKLIVLKRASKHIDYLVYPSDAAMIKKPRKGKPDTPPPDHAISFAEFLKKLDKDTFQQAYTLWMETHVSNYVSNLCLNDKTCSTKKKTNSHKKASYPF